MGLPVTRSLPTNLFRHILNLKLPISYQSGRFSFPFYRVHLSRCLCFRVSTVSSKSYSLRLDNRILRVSSHPDSDLVVRLHCDSQNQPEVRHSTLFWGFPIFALTVLSIPIIYLVLNCYQVFLFNYLRLLSLLNRPMSVVGPLSRISGSHPVTVVFTSSPVLTSM